MVYFSNARICPFRRLIQQLPDSYFDGPFVAVALVIMP